MKELSSDDIVTAFNSAVREAGLPPITEQPDAEMEAGWGTEIANVIQGIGVSNVILIVLVLKLNFSLHADIFQLDPQKGRIIRKKQIFGTDTNIANMVFEMITQFIRSKDKVSSG